MRYALFFLILLICPCVPAQDSPATRAGNRNDFESQVRPLLLMHCSRCHGPTLQKGGLRLDARHAAFRGGDSGPVIVPGKGNQSPLIERITSTDPDVRMPPDGPPLSNAEIELLRQWINDDAPWPESEYDREAARDRRLEHWSFQPLRTTVSSSDKASQGAASPSTAPTIDDFLRQELDRRQLTMSPRADPRTLIRRLSFDLHGLPPTLQQIKDFAADSTPEAWSRLVDQMLASPHYGEHWGQHWLDVIRYADTHGFEVNTPRENAWHYRDYVIRSFNQDLPYDQFITEQLAGDVVDADPATGFLVAAAALLPGQIGADDVSKRLARQDALDEMIVGTSNSLLGLSIGCARCHDHKFDPITADDYYALQAFFAGVEYGDRPIEDADQQERRRQAELLVPQIAERRLQLSKLESPAFTGSTLIIDEADSSRVTILRTPNGPGNNPEGTKRGYRDDPGSSAHSANISQGRYTWWDNAPGQDVMTWNPGVAGEFTLWLSWGAHGSGVHTRDARYIIDNDGNLDTRDDQREVAQIDQYYLAGIRDGETEKVPLWSGLQNVGPVTLTESSRIVLRGGETGTGITADVIVLQEVIEPRRLDTSVTAAVALPRLRGPVRPQENIELVQPVSARFVRFTTHETIDQNRHEPCLDELEIYAADARATNVALSSAGTVATSSGNYSDIGIHQLPHINDGLYGNDHSWISDTRGGGWVQLQLPAEVPLGRIVWGRDRSGKFQDRLPVRYQVEVSRNGLDWQTVASHMDRVPAGTPHDPILTLVRNLPAGADNAQQVTRLARELDQLQQQKRELETPRMAYAGTFRDPDPTFVLRRGDPEQRTTEISPAIPALFASAEISELPGADSLTQDQRRRMTLARWIASPANPLTARVMVNRIWLWHFGQGLVDTPNDFGLNGSRPTHPELLDWLAAEFIRNGWSVQHIHRLILNSAAYQQSSRIRPEAAAVDRNVRLLWRFPSRRLDAESIRDSMLAVSGELNLKAGGPGFNFFKARGGLDGFPPVEDFTAEELRRMVYAHKVRMESVPVFGAFDCPDAGQGIPRRGRSTTAIQALNLLNSPFVADRAEKFAARVAGEYPADLDSQVTRTFELAFGRRPTSTELTASTSVVRVHGLATLARVLFNSSEFLILP